jgi:geranylgeranyl pyrophosphate synthase
MASLGQLTMEVESAVRQLREELDRLLERRLPREIHQEFTPLQGKFNRARLVFGFAAAGGAPNLTAAALAAGVELLHLASLFQDDLVDGSLYRHGRLTLGQTRGCGLPILLSDWLFGAAYRFFNRCGPDCVVRMNRMVQIMAFSELRQELEVQRRARPSVFSGWRYNYGKTAVFFANCCRLGLQSACSDGPQIKAAGKIGAWFGMAYQLGNDLQELLTGPPPGELVDQDRQRGLLTLPLLFLLRRRPEMAAAVRMLPQPDLLQLLQQTGVIATCNDLHGKCLSQARRLLTEMKLNRPGEELIDRWLRKSDERYCSVVLTARGNGPPAVKNEL